MKESSQISNRSQSRLRRYTLATALAWTAFIAATVGWNVFEERREMLEDARHEAQISFQKEMLFQLWLNGHGGSDAPASSGLARAGGRALVNPGPMMRQVQGQEQEQPGHLSHLAGLNPLRPENAPDAWESKAIKAFAQGVTEVSSVEMIAGQEYMRVMRPLVTEADCLTCHSAQGYKVGNIRGGMSISVPLEPLWGHTQNHLAALVIGSGLIWLLGLAGIGFGARQVQQHNLERAKAIEELRNSEARYRVLLETSADGILIADIETKTFTYANPAMCRMLGYAKEELRTLGVTAIHPKDALPHVTAEFEALARGAKTHTIDLPCLRKDGTIFYADVNATAIVIDGRACLVGFFHDITERKRTEEAIEQSRAAALNMMEDAIAARDQAEQANATLRKAQRQMVREERLSALGQMASGIAHDFNNVLMPIQGYSELLLIHPENLSDRKNTLELLQIINKAAQDGSAIVKRLREFYRPDEQIELTSVNIKTVIEEAVVLTEPRWKQEAMAKGATVNIRLNIGTVPKIMGNKSHLQEVFINLILNAVDAMPRGGTLTFNAEQAGEAIVIRVADTGLGMAEETRAKCFEPFFSTKGLLGTGLGLSVVHGIIKRHLGTIEVESQLNSGTTFVIRLPTRPPEPEAKKIETAAARPIRGLRVLVVDDQEPVRNLVCRFLESDGHTYACAGNGREALEKFLAGKFDVVMTDRAMPGMTGDDLAVRIKATSPDTLIIMVTGFSSDAAVRNIRIPEVDVVLRKPLTLQDLQQALLKARPRNELNNADNPGGDR